MRMTTAHTIVSGRLRAARNNTAAAAWLVTAAALSGCSGDKPSAATTPASAAPAAVAVHDCAGESRVRPADITWTCADMGIQIKNVVWSAWDTRGATGRGVKWQKDCTPNCAAGRLVNTGEVTIQLANVQDGRFTRITVTGADGKPEQEPLP